MDILKKFVLSPYYVYFAAFWAVFVGADFIRSVIQNDPIWHIIFIYFGFAAWTYDTVMSYNYHKNSSSDYDELEGF